MYFLCSVRQTERRWTQDTVWGRWQYFEELCWLHLFWDWKGAKEDIWANHIWRTNGRLELEAGYYNIIEDHWKYWQGESSSLHWYHNKGNTGFLDRQQKNSEGNFVQRHGQVRLQTSLVAKMFYTQNISNVDLIQILIYTPYTQFLLVIFVYNFY